MTFGKALTYIGLDSFIPGVFVKSSTLNPWKKLLEKQKADRTKLSPKLAARWEETDTSKALR